MNKLGIRTITLLSQGLKATGTFEEAYFYVEESLYCDEASIIFDFCEWADKNVGGGSENNMEIIYGAFRFPKNKAKVAAAQEIVNLIARIKGIELVQL